jgi:UDP-N-acetylmuramoyl-tripeptide--D-alanyl-D-alanine ligase
LAVLNGDDSNVVWMRSETRARVRTFGFGDHNDVRATDVALAWPRGTIFTLHAAGQQRTVRIRLLGRYQVYPILAAVTVALEEGFSLDEVLPRVEAVEAERGRMAVEPLDSGAIVIRDEYKSSIETIDAALDVFAEIPASRRIVVLGEVTEAPGSQGPIYRRLGERIGNVASSAIFVTRNPTGYSAGAKRAGMSDTSMVRVGRNVRAAVEALKQDLRADDVVLFKGRDTQRLEWIALAVMGRTVRCEREFCQLGNPCDQCHLLALGSSKPL